MEDDREEAVRRLAREKWERQGRPEGQHERHWHEAAAELEGKDPELPQTSTPGEDGHVAATSGGDGFTEDGEASSPTEEPTAVPPGVVRKSKR
ncbi:hypothetical protein FHT86_001019 [Rhizobium sp. BK313]|uniref:DUF2934 domain-containing protein n=1 Tax=Rhizobium sp. BK313 TaxID=2587081 RepID=UPI00105F557C|nr:DUF2934 domain-containing protein [Rhizobium sp. BK313]MBB3452763.1 hypothetical protein [Rhizobium sp. BK313]